ncbi:hypothetical protein LN042_23520 [Kitasatospora sp. RB6PN24]|uniref:hypothetical protein n=1 Tax=Kitasatospora humi TaxID=2893891 RepID=UPI001E578E15|nr:hypothetical protein [Kitasatospora humi]MCC9310005.1 hypothetical protein [Kitasatospora humi]
MRRIALSALFAAATLVGMAAAPAQAASGQVVVYSTQFRPLDVYQDPHGCKKLPLDTHVVFNMTNSPIKVYADPFCTIPITEDPTTVGTLEPGHGSHAGGAGSFKAP